MINYFFKPNLENVSQGARLKFVRELRYMQKEDVAKFLNLKGKSPTDTITKYECNNRNAFKKRIQELAKLFEVNYEAIKYYDFSKPIDQVYLHMWEEEQMSYSEFKIDFDALRKSAYNMEVVHAFDEWEKMRKKREKFEITDYEYLEWKLHFNLENELN